MSTSPSAGPPRQYTQDELMLADVYAAALLEAAEEKGAAEEAAAELADFIRYMDEDHEFDLFMTADTVDDEPRRASLEKLFRGRMSDLLLNLLQVLNNRGRTGLVRAVARRVQLRLEARRHEQEVIVRTAVPLTDSLRDQVRRTVNDYIGQQAILIEKVDPGLIGGFVLEIGDIRVDASVTARLQTMLKRLMERAAAEVHRGERYVVEA